MEKLHERLFDMIKNNKNLKRFVNLKTEKIWNEFRKNPENYVKKYRSMFNQTYIENISGLDSLLEILFHKYALSEKNENNLIERQYMIFLKKYHKLLLKFQDLNLEYGIKKITNQERPEELILTGYFHYVNPLPQEQEESREKFLKILERIDREVYKEALRVQELLRIGYEDEQIEGILNKKIEELINSHKEELRRLLSMLGIDDKLFLSLLKKNKQRVGK